MSQRIFPITMPKWGIEMQQGTVTGWHAVPGQRLAKGDSLLDVETEKIVNSVEAPVDGVLRIILAGQGAVENVGSLIAVFADDSVPEAEVQDFIRGFKAHDASFEPVPSADSATTEPAPARETIPDGEVRVSPIARRVAERLGVDVALVRGTGRNGRVSKEDVEAFAAAGSGPTPDPDSPSKPGAPAEAAAPREKMSGMRATIARRLLESVRDIPHYRVSVDVEFTGLARLRGDLKESGTIVSLNDLLVRAAALTLMEHPAVNAQLVGDEIVRPRHADICIAVATEAGLLTPVVRRAELKSAAAISAEIRDLGTRARAAALTREEITGGSFTISNLGMFGVSSFDAIINPPQVAILAVGAALERLAIRNGQAVAVKVATLTLSADHRVVDGAVAARFMAALKARLEDPQGL